MKCTFMTLILVALAFNGWGQQAGLFVDYKATANEIHQLITHQNTDELKKMLANNGAAISDHNYFLEQVEESKQYLPNCIYLDRTTVFGTGDNGTLKTIISYRYRFTGEGGQADFEYSIYFTFNYIGDQTKNLDIVFVKGPDLERVPGRVHDDFIGNSKNK